MLNLLYKMRLVANCWLLIYIFVIKSGRKIKFGFKIFL